MAILQPDNDLDAFEWAAVQAVENGTTVIYDAARFDVFAAEWSWFDLIRSSLISLPCYVRQPARRRCDEHPFGRIHMPTVKYAGLRCKNLHCPFCAPLQVGRSLKIAVSVLIADDHADSLYVGLHPADDRRRVTEAFKGHPHKRITFDLELTAGTFVLVIAWRNYSGKRQRNGKIPLHCDPTTVNDMMMLLDLAYHHGLISGSYLDGAVAATRSTRGGPPEWTDAMGLPKAEYVQSYVNEASATNPTADNRVLVAKAEARWAIVQSWATTSDDDDDH